jgi:hypothetical protein
MDCGCFCRFSASRVFCCDVVEVKASMLIGKTVSVDTQATLNCKQTTFHLYITIDRAKFDHLLITMVWIVDAFAGSVLLTFDKSFLL